MSIVRWIKHFMDKYFKTMMIAFVVFVIAAVIFFLSFPFNVADFKKINILNEVQAGSLIKYKVDYCQNVGAGIERHTRRFLVPEDVTSSEPIELSSNPSLETLQNSGGCRTSKEIKLPIDASVPAGKYKLLIQVRYCILPVRCIPVQGYSDVFDIKKPDVPTQLSLIYEQLDQIQRAVGGQEQAVSPQTVTANAITLPSLPIEQSTEETIIPPSQPAQSVPAEQPQSLVDNVQSIVNNVLNLIRI